MRWILAAMLCLGTGGASAQNLSGNDLHQLCKPTGEVTESTYCNGYIVGVMEGVRYGVQSVVMLFRSEGVPEDDIQSLVDLSLAMCAPKAVTKGQMIGVGVKYLNDNPAVRHEDARYLLQMAWSEAFPCD